MNIGIVVKMYVAAVLNAVVPSTLITVVKLPVTSQIPKIPAPARAKAMGTPNKRATTNAIKGRESIIKEILPSDF
jgi:hypothetical protein